MIPTYPNREAALHHEDEVTFLPGIGYIRTGRPSPKQIPILQPQECTPASEIEDGAVVDITGPQGNIVKFIWMKEKQLLRVLQPGMGNRMAFSPTYLASHGWHL